MKHYTTTLKVTEFFLRATCFALIMGSGNFAQAASLQQKLFAPEPILLAQEKAPLNPTGCTMQDMVEFYKAELNILDAEVTLFRKRMRNPRTNGYAQRSGNMHLIVLAKGLEPSEIRVVTAHELVHIRQFVEGSIKKSEFKKDYLERNFEDEAFRLSLPLAAKFYQQLNCSQQHS